MNDEDRNNTNNVNQGGMEQNPNTLESGSSNMQNRQASQRPLPFQQGGQVNQLLQALSTELKLAKAAGNDAATAQRHYEKVRYIRQILEDLKSQQQNATQALGQPNMVNQQNLLQQNRQNLMQNPQARSGATNASSPAKAPMNVQSGVSSPANPQINSAVMLEKFNQVKKNLAEFDKGIQQLQNKRRSYNLTPEETSTIESQITELRNKYAQHQKFAVYIKAQLMKQSNAMVTGSPSMNASTPNSLGQLDVSRAPQPTTPSISTPGGEKLTIGQQVNSSGSNINRGSSERKSMSPATAAGLTSGQSKGTPQSTLQGPPPINLSGITKPSVPSIPISNTLNIKPPTAVTFKPNTNNTRPTLTSGYPNGMGQVLGTPAIIRMPTYDLASTSVGGGLPDNGGRVLTKRKLSELVNTIGADEGDGKTNIDGDVEELLLDLADEFISSVTGFACRLAKHRKVDSVDVRDVQLHLERNWNIRIPGYAMDEIRSTRKWQPNSTYNQKISGVEIAKSINGNMN